MFKGIILLVIIYIFSIIYNNYITPIILLYIPNYIYNNIIVSLIILIQIDNFSLYKENEDAKLSKKIIFTQLKILLKKQNLSKSFNENFDKVLFNDEK
jgi:hypothetical protein